MAVRIQQVAAEAGVSVATVSRAFQMPERVAEKTKAKVFAAVSKLDYVPNAQARTLRTSRTMLVIAMVPDIANPFFSEIIRGIEQVAKLNGYSVLLGDTQYDAENEQRYGDMISTRQADGLISLSPTVPAMRVSGRAPVVNACELIDDPQISSVSVDNRSAVRDATLYLLALGHRALAYIGGLPESPLSEARHSGFRDAMTAAGLPIDPHLCANGGFVIEDGVRAANIILSYNLPVTAFVCASDTLAIGAMQAVRSNGLSVPGDISIVGFDDIAMARYFDPPLTTVAQPCKDLGSEAMHMLLQILADEAVPTRKMLLPTQLIVRGSTAPPRGG